MQQQSSTPAIKTSHMKEVPFIPNNRRKFRFCSFGPRLVCEIFLLILIFVPLLIFAFGWSTLKGGIHERILDKTRLAPISDGFKNWITPPVTSTRAYRLFDIVNHLAVMTKSSMPNIEVRETLPFPYRLSIKKNNVEWLEDDRKLKYSVERIFNRQEEFGEELLEEKGAFIEVPRAMFRTKYDRTADPLFYVLGGNDAFNHSKAIDRLEGYISPLFAAISARMQGPNRDKYGFIYRYNTSNGYNFTIHTGFDNSSIKGKVIDFASEYTTFTTEANQWQNELFDGLTYPPLGNPTTRPVLNLFQADLCRPVQLRYNQTVPMLGIEQVHEYVLKLIDSDQCPQMDENCDEVEQVDITRCFSAELPPETIILTKPHMYGYNSSSVGINFSPDADKHESKVYIEPLTGTPIRAQSRVQLNINVWIDRTNIEEDGTLTPTKARAVRRLIPMMWIDQIVSLNDDILGRFKLASVVLETGHRAHQSFKLVYLLVGLFSYVAIVALIELLIWKRQSQKSKTDEKTPAKPLEIVVPVGQRTTESSAEPNSNDVTNVSLTQTELP